MDTIVMSEPQLLVTINDASLLNKLKSAIGMLNGVSSISVLKPKKSGIEEAREDMRKGRVTCWNSVDEMFDKVLGHKILFDVQNVLININTDSGGIK